MARWGWIRPQTPTGILAIVLMLVLAPSPAQATLFECMDAAGGLVMTDSPSQLQHCRTLFESRTDLRDQPAPRASASPAPLAAPMAEKMEPTTEPSPSPAKPDRPSSIAVPLQRIGSLFVVSITINESRDARVIVDTGASHTVLSRSIARDAGLYVDARSTPVTMQTVGGQVQGDIIRVESIKVADAEVKSSQAAIYDLPDAPPGVEGLLGLSFLRQFEVTLDAARNQLHLGRATP